MKPICLICHVFVTHRYKLKPCNQKYQIDSRDSSPSRTNLASCQVSRGRGVVLRYSPDFKPSGDRFCRPLVWTYCAHQKDRWTRTTRPTALRCRKFRIQQTPHNPNSYNSNYRITRTTLLDFPFVSPFK